ncbi:kinase domain protein [Teladorsagia circumcincta]|uniref:Kinase domain protein n=1 Tax=Teladorsagia circumcincta TaxID=45464 RepID=A0A2G9V2W9_TELCI|nr:kinase domain protein [Teladorsagia circumcincta]
MVAAEGAKKGENYGSDADIRFRLVMVIIAIVVSYYGGRDTDRFFGGAFEGDESDDDVDGVDDEPPAELVPLGMRGGSGSSNVRSPRNRTRSGSHQHKPGFFDFYKLTDEKLGAGAYASVRTCVSIASGKEYAVKWFEDDGNFYMVFEKMRGGPLLEHIIRKGYFTEEEARRVTVDIATALKFLHDRGIAHRDVKPENILCTEPDRVSPVKLCDLDLASRPVKGHSPPRMPQIASEPDLASPVGSAEFMAPEVVDAFVNDALRYDKRCDMCWSEGQPCDDCQQELFRRIQCGEYDFPADEWDMISAEAKHLVSSLLVKNVSERLTANEVLDHPWVKQSAPSTILQTPSNLFRIDSARDVQQMSEHFNVMNRLVAARLSSRLEKISMNEDEQESTTDSVSSASPTDPPPTQLYENDRQVPQALPLFMMPPEAFMDPFSGMMIYPPGSEPPSPAINAKNRMNATKSISDEGSIARKSSIIKTVAPRSSFLRARNSASGIRRYIASVSPGTPQPGCTSSLVHYTSILHRRIRAVVKAVRRWCVASIALFSRGFFGCEEQLLGADDGCSCEQALLHYQRLQSVRVQPMCI